MPIQNDLRFKIPLNQVFDRTEFWERENVAERGSEILIPAVLLLLLLLPLQLEPLPTPFTFTFNFETIDQSLIFCLLFLLFPSPKALHRFCSPPLSTPLPLSPSLPPSRYSRPLFAPRIGSEQTLQRRRQFLGRRADMQAGRYGREEGVLPSAAEEQDPYAELQTRCCRSHLAKGVSFPVIFS